MSAQLGFAHSNVLPRESATPKAHVADMHVLCMEASAGNMARLNELLTALAASRGGATEVDAVRRHQLLRQLQLMCRLVEVANAETTCVKDVRESVCKLDNRMTQPQLMALRKPLDHRVLRAAPTATAMAEAAAKSNGEGGELVVLPDGLPIAALRAQATDASPLQAVTLPTAPGDVESLILFYTYADTVFGFDWEKICCCAALCACCAAALCFCCNRNKSRDVGTREAGPEGDNPNPYTRTVDK